MMLFGFTYAYIYLVDEYCPGPFLGDYHKKTALLAVLECWLSYFWVLSKRPMTTKEKMRIINLNPERAKTENRLEVFPYDGVFYE